MRRVCRRSWRAVRRSLRWLRRPCRRCIPCVPVAAGAAGAAGVAGVASCASASNGSDEFSVKPKAAPRPSMESIFRRETSSLIIDLPVSRLPGPVHASKTISYEHRLNISAVAKLPNLRIAGRPKDHHHPPIRYLSSIALTELRQATPSSLRIARRPQQFKPRQLTRTGGSSSLRIRAALLGGSLGATGQDSVALTVT